MDNLAGKVAFVTGAASGIGLGIATALAQEGVKVMLADIEQEPLDAALAKLRQTNADVEGVIADVSLKEQLQAAADATIERFGKVHILVSNAGIGGGAGYGQWTDASWQWTMGVNLMSVIWGVEIFGPLIESHGEGGHIVNTASIAGLVAAVSPQYNVTKFGVVALSETLRLPMSMKNIGVSVLCPGVIRTRIMESSRNVPDRFAGKIESPEIPPELQPLMEQFAAAMANGIDPLYVGELVCEAIREDWPYILTDTEFEPMVEARFAEIKRGFDHVRNRVPRR
jgi:NAD(P)-dependent dehydrogenase (short-subunit alcohol dehydrogenase family)